MVWRYLACVFRIDQFRLCAAWFPETFLPELQLMHEDTRNSYVSGFNFPDRDMEEPSAFTHPLMSKFKHYCPQRFCRKHNKPEQSTKMNQIPNLRIFLKTLKFRVNLNLNKILQVIKNDQMESTCESRVRLFWDFFGFCPLVCWITLKQTVVCFSLYPLMLVSPRLGRFGMLNIFNHRRTPKSSCTCLRYASIIGCVYLWEDYGQTSASCNLWPGNIPHVIGSWVMSLSSLMASLEGWPAAFPPPPQCSCLFKS